MINMYTTSMPKKNELENFVIYFFRRDFRIQDNTAFYKAIEYCKSNENYKMICVFTLTHEQLNKQSNSYFSNHVVQFMVESLLSLYKDLDEKLIFYDGSSIKFLQEISKRGSLKAIFYNKDYTPYAKYRDNEIREWCNKMDIYLDDQSEDYTLLSIDKVKTANDFAYKVFTPFYNNAVRLKVNKPLFIDIRKTRDVLINYDSKNTLNANKLSSYYEYNDKISVNGGREKALKILEEIKTNIYKDYDKERDFPYLERTTLLSAYLKFGCCSIREAYNTIKKTYGRKHALLKQLYWKEFYANITYHYPHVLEGMVPNNEGNNKPMKKKMIDKIEWTNNQEWFDKWCNGETGFPIVDAGMRQLNETGFMHNRLRMITSGFLIKDLHIDWRKGEKYFASKLVDYDPASNNGGWQWSAGTGTDSQPYNRIFNPWTQIDRFDKDCKYIKKWIPELKQVNSNDIRRWYMTSIRSKHNDSKYATPIVDHDVQRKKYISTIYKD